MMTSERMMEIYSALQDVIARRNAASVYTSLGYTSNLDLIPAFTAKDLNRLLAEYLPDGCLQEMRPAVRIRNMQQLLETIVYFCLSGTGGEVDIEDPDLIRASFPCRNAMGGTAVQAALALDRLGAGSVVHLSDDSRQVREQLISPNIKVPLPDGSLGSAGDEDGGTSPETHVIIQFQKGSRICLGDQAETIPVSNRLILTRNTVNASLPLDENYLRWVEVHARQVSSNVLSSLNSILDPEVLKLRMARILEHVERYRSQNPRGIVYFEDAHYHSRDIRRLCIETLYPHVDIMSMNEEELRCTMDMFQQPIEIEDIFSCVNNVEYLLDRFGIKKGSIVHTKDYAMFVGDADGLEIEKGLVYGSLMATARAAFGVYGNDAQIRKILEGSLSRAGQENLEKIENSSLRDRVILVPTFALDRPKFTIGLGDCFTGGVQLCF